MRLRLLRLVVVATSAALAMIAHEHAALAEEPALRSDVTGTNAALTVAAGASSLKLLDFPFVGGHALAGISSELTEHFSLGGEAE
jgi:multisubunit Na+/H+ antiporter MnhB subunit